MRAVLVHCVCALAAILVVGCFNVDAAECDSSFRFNVIYFTDDFTSGSLDKDIKQAVDDCYNYIVLTEVMPTWNLRKEFDAAQAWTKLSQSKKTDVLEYAHEKGARIVASFGGSRELMDGCCVATGSPTAMEYAKTAAEFVKTQGLDGMDYTLEFSLGTSIYFKNGMAIDYIVDLTRETRKLLGKFYFISHSPQSPYIGAWAGNKRGYVEIMKQIGDEIDLLNIQYYDQSKSHTGYSDTFVSQPGWNALSAVKELMDTGLQSEKIVVGKPLRCPFHGSGPCFEPNDMFEYGCRAKTEFKWNGGFMVYRFDARNTDKVSKWGKTVNAVCAGDDDIFKRGPVDDSDRDVPEGGITDSPGGPGVTDSPGGPDVTESPGGPDVTDSPGGPDVTDSPGGPDVTDSPGGGDTGSCAPEHAEVEYCMQQCFSS